MRPIFGKPTPVKTLRAAVNSGAALLDEVQPDWPRLVLGGERALDHDEMLDLAGTVGVCGCVLGRTFGGYPEGLARLHLALGASHGFTSPIAEAFMSKGRAVSQELMQASDADFSQLAVLWTEAAKARLHGGPR